jgi:hypothetical protein
MAKIASAMSFLSSLEVIFCRQVDSFFRLSPPCITLATTSVFLSVSTISNISFPSSNKILSPVFTSFGKFYIS